MRTTTWRGLFKRIRRGLSTLILGALALTHAAGIGRHAANASISYASLPAPLVMRSVPRTIETRILVPDSVCGSDVSTPHPGIAAAEQAHAAYRDLQRMVTRCSYGQAILQPEPDAAIVRIGHLGCDNVTDVREYSEGGAVRPRCSLRSLTRWMVDALTQARPLYGVRATGIPDSYTTLVMPYVAACRWSGLARIGCLHDARSRSAGDGFGTCGAWINGHHDVGVYMHEFGHVMGLLHSAASDGYAYGDMSCAMGSALPTSGVRCFNAPQSYNLHWSLPILRVNAQDLEHAATVPALAIPSLSENRVNHVQIRCSERESVFVSFRNGTLGDENLSPSMTEYVYVHVQTDPHPLPLPLPFPPMRRRYRKPAATATASTALLYSTLTASDGVGSVLMSRLLPGGVQTIRTQSGTAFSVTCDGFIRGHARVRIGRSEVYTADVDVDVHVDADAGVQFV